MSATVRAFLFLFTALFALSAGAQPPDGLPTVVPNQIIVGFEPGTLGTAIAEAHRQAGGIPVQSAAAQALAAINAALVGIPSGNLQAAISAYENNPNVRYAEPNYLRAVIPDEGEDPPWPQGLGIDYFAEQYGLNNTGQSFYYDEYTGVPGSVSGAPDADIDAPEAWELNTGSPAVVVAVLDSGVDCAHPDLNGKCVEEINLGPSPTTTDDIGHGTHVAGIIGATGNNGSGVAGVGWTTSIAAIKVCYEEYDILFGVIGLCDSAASAAGMIHAADQGYQVINMSFAGPDASTAEQDAAAYAWNAGLVLVAAAANAYEMTLMYPAAFSNVIAVAATDWYDNLAGFSNFGPSWVSLAAPGYYIFNTLPNAACGLATGDPEGCYGWLSGTSMASPMVAGAAGVVWSHLGAGATNVAVRDALESNADATGAMGQNMLAWTQHGRLNLFTALDNAAGGATPPPPDPGEASVHVGDLDAARVNAGPSWMAQVIVTVHDQNHDPVSGVSVSGSWTSGASGNDSCSPTDGAGQCVIESAAIAKKIGAATFTVSSLAAASAYQSDANHDEDGSSDGTTITVVK
jgi:thermitase